MTGMNKSTIVTGLALCLLGGAGCRSDAARAPSDAPAAAIPNFHEVEPGVYRGGQPTKAGWVYLKAKGVRTVVKLDLPSEGSDDDARALGMTVIDASGPPSDLRNMFGAPKPERIRLAVDSLSDETLRPIFVHCSHGEDRTGLIVGFYRVLHDHQPKELAYAEMRAHGFHRSLRGLRTLWKRFDGKTLPAGEAVQAR